MIDYNEAKQKAKRYMGKDWKKLTEKQKHEAIQAFIDSYSKGWKDARGMSDN